MVLILACQKLYFRNHFSYYGRGVEELEEEENVQGAKLANLNVLYTYSAVGIFFLLS